MKECNCCGKRNPKKAKFCSVCGNAISKKKPIGPISGVTLILLSCCAWVFFIRWVAVLLT